MLLYHFFLELIQCTGLTQQAILTGTSIDVDANFEVRSAWVSWFTRAQRIG
jgi:hypothetical protein